MRDLTLRCAWLFLENGEFRLQDRTPVYGSQTFSYEFLGFVRVRVVLCMGESAPARGSLGFTAVIEYLIFVSTCGSEQ